MEILKFKTVDDLNHKASNHIVKIIQNKKNALISPATGNSPTGIYKKLVEKKNEFDPSLLKCIKLDEWADLDMNHEGSCQYYLTSNLLQPLNIVDENFISFNSKSIDPEKECGRIQQLLDANGPIDLCILGLGLNGHIAFNEPAEELQPHAHLAKLSSSSQEHPMVKSSNIHLKFGYTLGMADILQSKTILLIIHGSQKKGIFNKLLNKKITSQLPASFLWLHSNVFCYYCESDS